MDSTWHLLYNNNNNFKTSIVPISSKRIELSGGPSTGVGQTHSPGKMQSSSTNDQMEWKLRKDKRVWKGEISNGDSKTMLFDDLTCSGNVFQRIGTVTEKAWVPAWVLKGMGKEI